MARQFNLIPPICEQAEYHMFQREKVEVQLPELFHKIGGLPRPFPSPRPARPASSLPCSALRPRLRTPFPGTLGLTSPGFPLPGVGAMTWSPLACGIVSGKYDSGIPPYSRASLKVKERPGWEEGTGRRQAFWTDGALGPPPGAGPLWGLDPRQGTWRPC